MVRSTLFAGLASIALVWAGCSEGGAGLADAPTTDATPPDSSPQDSSPPDSSSVDSSPSDARADTSDAGGGDADSGPIDAPVDTAPAVPETLANIPGLFDFDFEDNTLAYRESSAPTRIRTCSIPGCTTNTRLNAVTTTELHITMAGGRIYYPFKTSGAQNQIRSIKQDGTDDKLEVGRSDIGILNIVNFYGGVENQIVDILWLRSAAPPPRATITLVVNPAVGRTASVPKASKYRHSNGDGAISQPVHGPGLPFSTAGATVPTMDGQTEIATTTRTVAGAAIMYPAVALVKNNRVFVCPTATDCAAWLDVAPGDTINFDATHLYIGGSTGLSRCALSEIGQRGTCTPASHVTGEPVLDLYLTPTHAIYRSNTLVRRVAK